MRPKLLLPLALVALAALVAGVWTGLEGAPPAELEALDAGARPEDAPEEPLLPGAERAPLAEPSREVRSLETTVVLPLELELELVEARGRLQADGQPPLGHARTARLRGSIHGHDGRAVRGAFAEVLAGPNAGRVLETDADGRFGASDLYAGLALVALRAPGTVGAEREVLLREGREAQLNVGFGRPSVLRGLVTDERNLPLPLARVVVDGQAVSTDERGAFEVRGVASGKVPVEVFKEGYAAHREQLFVTSGTVQKSDTLRYVLREGCGVRVVVPERVGLGRPGQLFVTGPVDGTRARDFPWHLVGPREVYAGGTVELEDLPRGLTRLQLFMPGARAVPAVQEVALFPGSTKTVTFHLEPAPVLRGRVVRDGAPVEGARVQLEAPDVTGAASRLLGDRLGRVQYEVELLAQMPPAVQVARTRADGGFELSAAVDVAAARYLTALGPDGRGWAGRVVGPDDGDVTLELVERAGGDARLTVETSERFQALPVSYVVDGVPHRTVLAPRERLELEGLAEGRWKVRARWGNERMLEDLVLELEGERDLFVPLPQGAIDGQPRGFRDAMR
jgi:hypothetical protein